MAEKQLSTVNVSVELLDRKTWTPCIQVEANRWRCFWARVNLVEDAENQFNSYIWLRPVKDKKPMLPIPDHKHKLQGVLGMWTASAIEGVIVVGSPIKLEFKDYKVELSEGITRNALLRLEMISGTSNDFLRAWVQSWHDAKPLFVEWFYKGHSKRIWVLRRIGTVPYYSKISGLYRIYESEPLRQGKLEVFPAGPVDGPPYNTTSPEFTLYDHKVTIAHPHFNGRGHVRWFDHKTLTANMLVGAGSQVRIESEGHEPLVLEPGKWLLRHKLPKHAS